MQPCVSPVWDTCIAMVALEEAGLPPDHPALVKSADWILSQKQVLGPGDWQVKTKMPNPEAGFSSIATIFIRTWTTPRLC